MVASIAVIGSSLAGLRAAETLRTQGFDGRIHFIGDEPHPPYDRPPLSKKVLAGEWEPERVLLRKADAFQALDLTLHLGQRATALDPTGRTVTLADGGTIAFDGCVIATGAHCRRLPNQPNLAGIFELRTIDDSLALRDALAMGTPKVCVIGAGFIGAEVAATARERGLEVTIVEALPVPLLRGLGAQMGPACAAIHGDHGVDLKLGVGVDGFLGASRVEAVRLNDGTVIEADVVVVGIGAAPTTGWLEGSGLTVTDGIVCDAFLSTGAPGIYAAGDVARWPNEFLGEEVRIEHWTNAADHGEYAAKNLLGELHNGDRAPYSAVPFFWSDQYDRRIQFLGRAKPDDRVTIAVGSVDERSFVALYERDGMLAAVFGMNQPKATMRMRAQLAGRASFEDALAAATGQ